MSVDFLGQPEGLGVPLGRYSHVSVAQGTQLVTVAGQVGITASGELAGDGSLAEQVDQAFRNIEMALRAANASLRDVFKTTTFLVGAENLDEFMKARGKVFAELFSDGVYPPNTLLVVNRLVEPRFLVEIEASAMRPATSGAH